MANPHPAWIGEPLWGPTTAGGANNPQVDHDGESDLEAADFERKSDDGFKSDDSKNDDSKDEDEESDGGVDIICNGISMSDVDNYLEQVLTDPRNFLDREPNLADTTMNDTTMHDADNEADPDDPPAAPCHSVWAANATNPNEPLTVAFWEWEVCHAAYAHFINLLLYRQSAPIIPAAPSAPPAHSEPDFVYGRRPRIAAHLDRDAYDAAHDPDYSPAARRALRSLSSRSSLTSAGAGGSSPEGPAAHPVAPQRQRQRAPPTDREFFVDTRAVETTPHTGRPGWRALLCTGVRLPPTCAEAFGAVGYFDAFYGRRVADTLAERYKDVDKITWIQMVGETEEVAVQALNARLRAEIEWARVSGTTVA